MVNGIATFFFNFRNKQGEKKSDDGEELEGSIKEQLEEERWKHKSKWMRERRKEKKGREKKLQVGNKESFESWSVLLP